MTKTKRLEALNKQINSLANRLVKLNKDSSRFSKTRLIIFLTGFATGILCNYFIIPWLGWSILIATLFALNIVAFFHRRLLRSIQRHEIWLELKKKQVARMQLDWQNIPAINLSEADAAHPFELDLDITGKYSLHRLLDTALSRDGSDLLKTWLLHLSPELPVIEQRQQILKELAPLARFRDKLYLAFRLVSKEQLDGKKLLHFLEKQQFPAGLGRVLVASAAVAVVNAVLYVFNALQLLPAWWMLTLTIYGFVYLANQRFIDSLLDDSVLIAEQLKKLKAVLFFLERYPYGKHAGLRGLCEPFWSAGNRPSTELQRITWLGFAIGLRMNPVFRLVLNVFVPLDFYLVRLLTQVEQQLYNKLVHWLEVLVELEALNSLANFAYLNPGATFPKLLTGTMNANRAVLHVETLGHPLISESQRRCNDFAIAATGDVALITGSNMSGKSTFLKTLGVNLALAYAGGPVFATRFETGLFRIFTCIQINDSVTDGFSFFYTEVRRLKALLESLQSKNDFPLFFLIDEIFKGTNNRERLIGSRAYIQALAGHNGLGAISTHDLELTTLADSISQITNYHFREKVIGSKMVFDYQIRTGPCPSTNAVKIMKMEGLPVGDILN